MFISSRPLFRIFSLRFQSTFRHRQRTREALRQGDPNQLISPRGLDSKGQLINEHFHSFTSILFSIELEKAVVLFDQQKLHDRIQTDNYERYKRLREKRRDQAGLS